MRRSSTSACATPPTRSTANSSAATPAPGSGKSSAISVTLLGKSAGITPITRSGAKPGDGIYVTGPLGGSILGRHMTFEPRVHLARKLAQGGVVTAMLDISDGLSRDLAAHLCDLRAGSARSSTPRKSQSTQMQSNWPNAIIAIRSSTRCTMVKITSYC